MKQLSIGDRVRLKESALSISYIKARLFYMDLYEGKVGTVIGTTDAKDKFAIEFDEECFTKYEERLSKFDNGCFGKGKLHHCMYIPVECVVAEDYVAPITDNALIAIL
jgi:hypothetical protein